MADEKLDYLASDYLPGERRRCAGQNSRGEPCRMAPLSESEWCWSHSPAVTADRAKARRRGGKAGAYTPASDGAPVPLRTIEETREELAKLYGETRAALIPPDRARVLNAMLGRALEILNVGAFEERLAALEAGQAHTGPRRVA